MVTPVGAEVPNADAVIKTLGKPVKTASGESFILTMPKATWAKLNDARAILSQPMVTYEEVNQKPWANREYVHLWLMSIHNELKGYLGQPPTAEQTFVAFKEGVRQFQKQAYDVHQADADTKQKLEWYRSLQKLMYLQQNPPPLSTDARRPVPTRYYPVH